MIATAVCKVCSAEDTGKNMVYHLGVCIECAHSADGVFEPTSAADPVNEDSEPFWSQWT